MGRTTAVSVGEVVATIPWRSTSDVPEVREATDLVWKLWNGGKGTAGGPTASWMEVETAALPCTPPAPDTKTPAPPAPLPQTQRRKASFWASAFLCRHS